MKIIYADVPPLQFVSEMEVLFPQHYEELCVTKDFPLDPDYDAYRWLANSGMLRVVTVRADEELIGYAVFIIRAHLHYKSCLTATEDIYYIKPEYRRGRIGIRLFKYAEECLKRLGVQRIIMHTKVHLDNSKIFEYLGYKQTDKLFTKLL